MLVCFLFCDIFTLKLRDFFLGGGAAPFSLKLHNILTSRRSNGADTSLRSRT